MERADGRSQIKRCLARAERLFETARGPHAVAHRDHAELQAAQRDAPLRIAAALRRRWSGAAGRRVRGGAEPQSPAGLLPQRSEPDQREAAGKMHLSATLM